MDVADSNLANRVPEITIYFWIIKVLATTVGETAADFLSETLDLGLGPTTAIMVAVLMLALAAQFAVRRYVAGVYWLVVVLLSVVGTLVTDGLVDELGVPLVATTIVFAVALGATFAAWYASERTLSIHSILTTKREAFYWLAILFTFALGTAAGDLIAEGLAVGFWQSAVLFGALIVAVAGAWRFLGLPAVPAFWMAYILTRPLGASMGDFLSQSTNDGGLDLGTVATSGMFLATILAVVGYLMVSGVDRTPPKAAAAA